MRLNDSGRLSATSKSFRTFSIARANQSLRQTRGGSLSNLSHQNPSFANLETQPPEWGERIESMFLGAFGRPAEAGELADSTEFLQKQLAAYGSTDRDDYRAWADLGHVLINSKEFIFVR